MEMHAYSEDYLLTAQRILGDMLDYAVNEYEFDPDEFYKMFLVSDVSRQFQEGNPTYIAGKNGCEMVKEVIRSAGLIMEEIPDEMYLDKSPEYWAGWALAYYQWYTARPFMKIYKVVTIEDLLKMYSVYHEMDIMKFVEAINEKWDQYYTETNLKRLRKIAGLSQRELADLSGVALRQIQLFEQKMSAPHFASDRGSPFAPTGRSAAAHIHAPGRELPFPWYILLPPLPDRHTALFWFLPIFL